MKPIVLLTVLAMVLGFGPAAFAQDDDELGRGSVGAFVNYFRHQRFENNMVGIGGRIGFGSPSVQFEAEFAYDFRRTFTEGFTDTTTGEVTFVDSDVRLLHGLFGPKFQTTGPARVFFTVKAGFLSFRFDDDPVTPGTIVGQFADLRAENTRFALYPGVGFDASLGPIGIRFDVGDEIYWQDGAHHNLRIAIGPQIRF